MFSLTSITLEVDDLAVAERFYSDAFTLGNLGDLMRLRAAGSPTAGFRGFTLSLLVSQPADVHRLVDAAVAAGATVLKPAAKSMWGHGGVVQAPDGTIWKVATSARKDTAPATGRVESVVLLLGVADVGASRRFYLDRGLTVGKSFGSRYVEFEASGPVKLALYRRRALAKDAGVAADGSGSHRLVIGAETGPSAVSFVDPDGFAWEHATPGASLVDDRADDGAA
jgi:predicted lactoylglutathione lyase